MVGAVGALAVLAGTGALLVAVSLVTHATGFRLASDELSPGLVGSALLLLASLAYLPNAVVWAMAYVIGPGFAFGAGTVLAPTGSVLGPVPLFPMLAALPAAQPGPHAAGPGAASLAVLAVPYLAGAFGGLLTVRTAPSPTIEAAPLWGLACGAAAGCVTGALAVFSGGPLGTGRLAVVGPSGWQVALVATLEIGISAAIVAGIANWLLIRRRRAEPAARPEAPGRAAELDGHRIYVNPWTDGEHEAQPPDHPVPGAAAPFPVPVEPRPGLNRPPRPKSRAPRAVPAIAGPPIRCPRPAGRSRRLRAAGDNDACPVAWSCSSPGPEPTCRPCSTRAPDESYGARVVAVGADRDGCAALDRARSRGIPTFAQRVKDFPERAGWDRALAGSLRRVTGLTW